MNDRGLPRARRATSSRPSSTRARRSRRLKTRPRATTSTPKEKKELTDEEKEYKSKRKQIQEKLIKFATRIPAFMYLTDFRENTLQDVITKLEPDLFQTVTGLTVDDFNLLVSPQRLQHRAHEPGGVRVPPLRGLLSVLHRHRLASGPHALR